MHGGSDFESLELSKIISIFNKNNIKLTFDNFSQLNEAFSDILPICVHKIESLYAKNGYFSKLYTLSCKKKEVINVKKYFQYFDLKLLNNKDHFSNIQSIEKIAKQSRRKNIPILDINGIFGVEFSSDEKYLKSNQYILYPSNLSDGDTNQKIQGLLSYTVNSNWHDYIISYLNNDTFTSVMSVDFNLGKQIESIRYLIYKRDFKKISSYVKMDNFIEFLTNEYHLHNFEQDQLYLQFPSSFNTRYDSDYICIEMMPINQEMAHAGFYFDFLEDYLTKMIEYELLTNIEKDFILNHETTKNKSNLLRLVWNNKNDYEVQWANIEFNKRA